MPRAASARHCGGACPMSLPSPSHAVQAAGTVDAMTVTPVLLALGSGQSGGLTLDTLTGSLAAVAAAK